MGRVKHDIESFRRIGRLLSFEANLQSVYQVNRQNALKC